MILQNKSFSSRIKGKFKTLPILRFLKNVTTGTLRKTKYFKRVSEEICYIISFRTEAVSEGRGAVA
jgi:hypothetical protein